MSDVLDRLVAAIRATAPPQVNAPAWADALTAPMRSSGLTTPRRAAMFLGQIVEESRLTILVENLNYSAEGLRAIWGTHFAPTPGKPAAELYARQPERIANYVYSSVCHPDLGNGDEASGDGWRFRGTGPIELTGRAILTRFGKSVGRSPEDAWAWAQTLPGAAASACWYWLDRGQLLALSDAWDIAGVTRRINGALTNLQTRVDMCNAALKVFGDAAPAPSQNPVSSSKGAPSASAAPDPDNSADTLNALSQQGGSFPLQTKE